jgi:hypothetical protein
MANFRKYALAFAGAACFLGITGAASAQTTSGINCVANAATPLQMRAEGITENAGDVVLSCTGGTVTPAGTPAPTVNVTVALNTQVTSRLISGSITDALLLIDDPAPGAQNLCAININNYCSTVVLGTGAGGGKGNNYYGSVPNMFQGVLTASNTLTFFNVPIDPPGPAVNGVQPVLTIRITDVRANASALGAPTGFSSTSVTEFISTSAAFTISNPSQTVGNVLTGLVNKSTSGVSSTTTTLPLGNLSGSTGPTLTQCQSKSLSSTSATAAVLEYANFSEGFATATKLQYSILGTGAEGIPGNLQNAESNFLPNGTTTSGLGVADFATRVKLTFGSIPTGVTIYTPTTLPSSTTVSGVSLSALTVAQVTSAGSGPTEFMTLTASETGSFSAVSPSSTANLPGNSSLQGNTSLITALYGGFAPVTLTSGGGVAVYQVTQQATVSQNTIETFSVPIIITYSASPATNSPGLGATTLQIDFAPSSTVVTASSGPIPRFVQTSPNLTSFTISACATNLLFPFISNQAGFDTGLAIAATSSDPFGTALQSGTCTLNFYGTGAPAAFVTPSITAGTVYTALTSNVAAGFQGYMIAQCKFQYAHGFAFITDGFGGPGKGLSEGYLALIIPDTSVTGGRGANPNVTTSGSGEILSN